MKTITSFHLCLSVAAILLTSGGIAHATEPSKAFTPLKSSKQVENYGGGSIGSSTVSGLCGSLQNCDSSASSWKLFAGIPVNENIFVESAYVNLGKQNAEDQNGDVTRKATAITMAALANYQMNDQIQLFGKAGLARWTDKYTDSTGSSKNTGTGILVGAGAHYDLGDNMGVRAEWERFKDVGTDARKGDIDLLSVGLTFSSL